MSGATRASVLAFVRERLDTEPDHPFSGDTVSAVLRHRGTGKWFALLMTVRRDRLGLSGGDTADILNLKCPPVLAASLRSQPGFLPAYHMNRDHWISILLDGTVAQDQVESLLELSYELTRPKRRPKRQQPS